MENSGNFADKLKRTFYSPKDEVLMEETAVEVTKIKEETGAPKVKRIFRLAGKWIYHLRKVVMAIPVIYYALKLAAYNTEHLPEMVGIDLQSSGEFAEMISREAAVNGPLMVTGVCLALMFLSRKSVYPWIISIFSLVLPLLLLLTNIYPM